MRKLLEEGSIPLDRLMVETDSPFMYPNTRASKLPSHVKDGLTERSVTHLHFMKKKPEDVALATSFNAMKLFGLS